MRKSLIILFLMLMCSLSAKAFELSVDITDTRNVIISTSPVTPTQILTNNQAIMRTYIINTSSNNVWIVGPSTTSLTVPATFSVSLTTGSFILWASSGTAQWSPDGETDPYRGPMWAMSQGTGGSVLRIFRAK